MNVAVAVETKPVSESPRPLAQLDQIDAHRQDVVAGDAGRQVARRSDLRARPAETTAT